MADGSAPGTMDRHQVLGYGERTTDTRRWSLIVGHGGVFRVAMCCLLDLPLEHFWNFDFGLAAIAVVEIRAGRAVLRAANLDSHLSFAMGAAGPGGSAADASAAPSSSESTERNASGAL